MPIRPSVILAVLQIFSTFFEKGVDKPFPLWYYICVIQRQQVPVKAAFAQLSCRGATKLPYIEVCLSSCRSASLAGERFFYINFSMGGENKNAQQSYP